MNNASKINSLKPGGRVVISSSNGITVAAERSGNGKTLYMIRETKDGFTVFQTTAF
jgi:Tol biopolymer transport system component